MQKKFTAIVPMKGHSLRLPNKNIKNFDGKPLFYWVIRSLFTSKFISGVVVDTESLVIEKLCRKYFPNIEITRRPKNLRGDSVSVNKIIAYDLGLIEGEFFVQTHSTNPLLKAETIDVAIKRFLSSRKFDSLFAVNEIKSRLFDSRLRPINHNLNKLTRTQDLDPIYEDNSNFYIFTRDSFKKTGSRIGKKAGIFVMDKLESVDIDTLVDFKLAEAIFKLRPKPN